MKSAFSILHSNCSSFAHISSDNRLYIHNLKSERRKSNDSFISKPKIYVDKNHLAHVATCCSWSNSFSKESTSTDGTIKNNYFVIGYSDGMIIIWDLNRGVPVNTINNMNDSSIVPSSIVFSHDHKSIFVSSLEQNYITQIEIASGNKIKSFKIGKKGASLLEMHPSIDAMIACSSSIKIIDVESGSKRKLEATFAGGVQSAKFTKCGRFLAAASKRSRELLIFDIRADSEQSAPIYVIPVKGMIVSIDAMNNTQQNTDQLDFLCIFEDHKNGVFIQVSANYIENQLNGIEGIEQIDIESSSDEYLITGRFNNDNGRSNNSNNSRNSGSSMAFVLGSELNPIAVNIDATSSTQNMSSSLGTDNTTQQKERRFIFVSSSPQRSTSSSSSASKGILHPQGVEEEEQDGSGKGLLPAPIVLGPHEMGGKKRPIVDIEKEDQSQQHQQSKKGSSSNNVVELTLEQRLEALSHQMNRLEEGELLQHTNTDKGVNINNRGGQGQPTSDSLVTLIDQALQSGDDGLLEQCFSCDSPTIIEATAQRLATSKVVLFLKKLVAKFEKRPSRGILLTQWLTSVLRYHTAYLVTLPDLSNQLAGLSQMLEQRLSSYTKLSSLAGRLDLLMSQVTYSNNQGNNNNIDNLTINHHTTMIKEIKPMNIYTEE